MKETALKQKLILFGFVPKHKGFYYISDTLERLINSRGEDPVEAYRRIFSHSFSARMQIERCMRYAIGYAWNVSNGTIREMFPQLNTPPSPMEFMLTFLIKIVPDDEK